MSFVQFGVELVVPLTKSTYGNKYIVVLTNDLMKWHEVEAVTNKEASMIAKFQVKVICRYYSARIIITDQGRDLKFVWRSIF